MACPTPLGQDGEQSNRGYIIYIECSLAARADSWSNADISAFRQGRYNTRDIGVGSTCIESSRQSGNLLGVGDGGGLFGMVASISGVSGRVERDRQFMRGTSCRVADRGS